jgi:uncharacterized membrane protein HdeD (DUF308 family)
MFEAQPTPPITDPVLRDLVHRVARWWWVGLLTGAVWIVLSVVVLKFNHASVATVGILIGLMFLVASAQEFVLALLDRRWRWMWALFSALLFAGGIVSLVHPRNTFAGFADILGFVFLLIGMFWIMRAFTERPLNDLWWLTLTSGVLMIVLAFWTSGQFYLVRAATLLVFAGIWALMQGVTDIVRAFQVRKFAADLTAPVGHDGGGREGVTAATPQTLHTPHAN